MTLPAAAAAQGAPLALEGEYGLWVERTEDSLTVHWLTKATGPGRLEATVDGRRWHETTTRPSFIHRATLPLPEAPALTLHYGLADAGEAGLHRTTLRLAAAERRDPVRLTGVDSLYVVGDVHGAYDTFLALLRAGGLVDGEGRWTGGDRHLVLLGDLFDRGPHVTRTLWFLYGLEAEAGAAGGGVHLVLGNHEIMVLTGDLRYVSPREAMRADLYGVPYHRLFHVRRSVLGRWLASKPALLRVDGILLAHGGLSPRYAGFDVRALDDTLAAYLREDLFLRWTDTTVRVPPMDSAALERRIDFLTGSESLFWYRGWLATELPDASESAAEDDAAPGCEDRKEAPAAGDRAAPGCEDRKEAPGAGDRAAPEGDGRTKEGARRAEGDVAASGGAGRSGADADSIAARLQEVLDRRGATLHVVAHTPLDTIRAFHRGRLIGVDLRRPATELLLLARSQGGWEARRMGLDGRFHPVWPPELRPGSSARRTGRTERAAPGAGSVKLPERSDPPRQPDRPETPAEAAGTEAPASTAGARRPDGTAGAGHGDDARRSEGGGGIGIPVPRDSLRQLDYRLPRLTYMPRLDSALHAALDSTGRRFLEVAREGRLAPDSALSLLLAGAERAERAGGAGRAVRLLALDRVARSLEPAWREGRARLTPRDSLALEALRDAGLDYRHDELGATWIYQYDRLREVWSTAPEDSPWWEHAFVQLQMLGWDATGSCGSDAEIFGPTVTRGERFLEERPDSPLRVEVALTVAQARETRWSLARIGERDPLRDHVDPAPLRAEAHADSGRALALYRRVAGEIDPGSLLQRYAATKAEALARGFDTKHRKYLCVYD